MQGRADVAVGTAGAEAGVAEDPPVKTGAPGVHAGGVAAKAGIVGIGFEKGDTGKERSQDMEAHDELVIRDIVKAVAADEEVAGTGESGEVPERTMEKVAALAEPFDGIRARINARVFQAGAELFQDRLPLPFSASDIEDGPDRTLEVVFSNSDG